MGERVKIPLLPNKVGKRSGTMTMVTTYTIWPLDNFPPFKYQTCTGYSDPTVMHYEDTKNFVLEGGKREFGFHGQCRGSKDLLKQPKN